MTFTKEEAFKGFHGQLIVECMAITTIESYVKITEKFIDFVDSIESINLDVIHRYIKTISHLAPRTMNIHYAVIRKFMKYLYSKTLNEAYKIKLQCVKQPKHLPKVLSKDVMLEKLKVLKNKADTQTWIQKRNYALVMLIYGTGARISEALNVRLGDIKTNDETGTWLHIRKGKGDKERYVPINDMAVDALNDYAKACPFDTEHHLFLNYKGCPLSRTTAYTYIHKEIGVSPHEIRHSFATHLMNSGCDLIVIGDFLGHSSLLTTQIYLHVEKESLYDVVMNCHPIIKDIETIFGSYPEEKELTPSASESPENLKIIKLKQAKELQKKRKKATNEKRKAYDKKIREAKKRGEIPKEKEPYTVFKSPEKREAMRRRREKEIKANQLSERQCMQQGELQKYA